MTDEERKSLAIEAAFLVFGDAIVEAELTGPERGLLYEDILRVHDETDGFVKDAAEVLKLRIGGSVNLRNYVNCLTAGADRAQAAEDGYDESVDAATQAVINEFGTTGRFDGVTLPEGGDLSDLMIRINDSVTALFAEYK